MPTFGYKAVDKDGKVKKGSSEASSIQHVYDTLKAQGMMPIEVAEQGALNKDLDLSFGKKIKPRDLCLFCRQFVSILQAGVSIRQALGMLAEETENKFVMKATKAISESIEKGNTLTESMRSQMDTFPAIMIHLVEAGEKSGNLEMAFNRMAIHFEREAKLKALVKKAMIYPVILVVACLGVIAVMLGFVIPTFMGMFQDLDVEMPAITVFVINASNVFLNYWYLILLTVAAVIFLYKWIYQTEKGRLVIDDIKLHVPIFGTLALKTACAEFSRTLGVLMGTGIPMIECLEITQNVLTNIHFKNVVGTARDQVMKGIPLTEPLKQSEVFPPMVYHMTGIGEETGNLVDMLEKLTIYYDEEVEIATQAVMAAMEPMIIVALALIVGTLVMAIIMPMVAMYEGLDNL